MKPFSTSGVTPIVDLESAAFHEPGPGPLDDPSLWEKHEGGRMDTPHDLGVDPATRAVTHEGVLEAAVAPQLLEPARLGLALVEHGDPTRAGGYQQRGPSSGRRAVPSPVRSR